MRVLGIFPKISKNRRRCSFFSDIYIALVFEFRFPFSFSFLTISCPLPFSCSTPNWYIPFLLKYPLRLSLLSFPLCIFLKTFFALLSPFCLLCHSLLLILSKFLSCLSLFLLVLCISVYIYSNLILTLYILSFPLPGPLFAPYIGTHTIMCTFLCLTLGLVLHSLS